VAETSNNKLSTGLKGGVLAFSAISVQLISAKKGCTLIASTNFKRLFLSLAVNYSRRKM
jgi:hypothetical protein